MKESERLAVGSGVNHRTVFRGGRFVAGDDTSNEPM